MKRSRIFLGLTAGCLAVAGAVAAKVKHFTTFSAYYQESENVCSQFNVPCVPKQGAISTCKISVTSGSPAVTIFTQSDGAKCTSPLLYTKTEVGL